MNGSIKQEISYREQPHGERLQSAMLNSSGRIPSVKTGDGLPSLKASSGIINESGTAELTFRLYKDERFYFL
jgi:hypothetical protein